MASAFLLAAAASLSLSVADVSILRVLGIGISEVSVSTVADLKGVQYHQFEIDRIP